MSTLERKAELVLKLREYRQGLFATVEAMPEADTERPIFEMDGEATTIKQELDRLARMEAAYRGWVLRSVSEREPDVTEGVEGDLVPAPTPDVNGLTLDEIFERLRSERRETLALIDDLEPLHFGRYMRTPMGMLSVDEVLATFYRHDRELTLAIYGHDSTNLPRFLVGEYIPRRRYA
jgi:hypothetical protein